MENNFKGKALNTVVVVEQVHNENKTASGFDLSSVVNATEKQLRGKVVSVGTECPKLSDGRYTIHEGDIVIFDKFKMTPFTQDGIAYIMIDYRDLVWVG
jgi:co-chaperonin GroES (HSP10)